MSRKKLFNETRMELVRVDPGGTAKEPKAYLILEAELKTKDFLHIGLQELRETDIVDQDERIPLDPDGMNYGDDFMIEMRLAPVKDDQGEMFEGDTILGELVAEKLVTVSLKKNTLKQSVLIPLKNGAAFWPLRDKAAKAVEVTITQGTFPPKQTEIEA